MKILKEGKIPLRVMPPWWARVYWRCGLCGTIFILEEGDSTMFLFEVALRDPAVLSSESRQVTCACPLCHAPVTQFQAGG